MTEARYTLLLELYAELKADVEKLRATENIEKYATDLTDFDEAFVVLRGDEPWQYGEPVSAYVAAELVIDEQRAAYIAKRSEEGRIALARQQELQRLEAEDKEKARVARDLEKLQKLITEYPEQAQGLVS